MPNQYTDIPKRAVLTVIGPSIAYVELTQGMYALIDSDDASKAQAFNWHAKRFKNGWYAARNEGRNTVLLHRFVINSPEQTVDHVNHRTLDCPKSVLREASLTQQCMNRRPWGRSGVAGIFQRSTGKWIAYIQAYGIRQYLGQFGTREEAIAARLEKQKSLHGEFAYAT